MADENTTPVEETVDDTKALCPCCGQPTLMKPVKVDGKIVDDYLASILTGVPFSHTFPMFDGRLKVTLAVSDREESIRLYSLILMMEPYIGASATVKDFIGLVNMYFRIKQISVRSGDKEGKVYFPAKHILEACDELSQKWENADLHDETKKAEFLADIKQKYLAVSSPDTISSTPPVILNKLLSDFGALEKIMLEAGFDENFWKGIKLA